MDSEEDRAGRLSQASLPASPAQFYLHTPRSEAVFKPSGRSRASEIGFYVVYAINITPSIHFASRVHLQLMNSVQ